MITGILVLILFFAIPITQIVLSRKRIKGKSKLPIAIITLLAFIIGMALSFSLVFILPSYPLPSGGRCMTGPVTAAIVLAFLLTASALIIGVVSGGVYLYREKR